MIASYAACRSQASDRMPSRDVGGIVELVPDPADTAAGPLRLFGLVTVASDDIRLQ